MRTDMIRCKAAAVVLGTSATLQHRALARGGSGTALPHRNGRPPQARIRIRLAPAPAHSGLGSGALLRVLAQPQAMNVGPVGGNVSSGGPLDLGARPSLLEITVGR